MCCKVACVVCLTSCSLTKTVGLSAVNGGQEIDILRDIWTFRITLISIFFVFFCDIRTGITSMCVLTEQLFLPGRNEFVKLCHVTIWTSLRTDRN